MADVTTASIITWFSHLKESAYGTKRVAGDVYRRVGEIEKVLFDVVPNFTPDMENSGADESVDSFLTTNMFRESPLNVYFSFQDIPYWLQMICGTLGSAGSSAPYTHTITPLNKATTRIFPTRTFGQRKGSDILIYPSVGLRELRIAKDATGRLKVTITPHGQGTIFTNPASYAVPSVVSDRVYGFNNQVAQTLNDTVASVSQGYSCAVESWEWVFTNQQESDGYRDCSPEFETGNPAAGQVKSEHLVAAYDWKVNLVVRLDSADPARTMMRTGNLITVSTAITSTQVMTATPYSCGLSHTKAKITSLEDTAAGAFIHRAITAELKANKSDGLMPFTATVVNDKASYLT